MLGDQEFIRIVIPRVKLARAKATSNYKIRWENQVIYRAGIQIRDQSKNNTLWTNNTNHYKKHFLC